MVLKPLFSPTFLFSQILVTEDMVYVTITHRITISSHVWWQFWPITCKSRHTITDDHQSRKGLAACLTHFHIWTSCLYRTNFYWSIPHSPDAHMTKMTPFFLVIPGETHHQDSLSPCMITVITYRCEAFLCTFGPPL